MRPPGNGRLAIVLTLIAAACTGSTLEPDDGTDVVETVRVSPAFGRLVTSGDALTFSAVAHYSNGAEASLPIAWSVDQPAVASIDASGLAVATSPGVVSIMAEVDGVVGSAVLLVDPDTTAPRLADVFADRVWVNIFQRPGVIRLRAEFEDAESGARSALATFDGPLGAGITGIVSLEPLPADSASPSTSPEVVRTAFAGFLQIPANVGVGVWRLAGLRVDDRARNSRQWGTDELAALGLTVEVRAVVTGG